MSLKKVRSTPSFAPKAFVRASSDSILTRRPVPIFRTHAEHVNDMVYSVEKLNSLVSAARVDLESFKSREKHHKRGTCSASHHSVGL